MSFIEIKSAIAFIFIAGVISEKTFGVSYVEAPPFTKVIQESVVGCSNSDPVQIPLITWGGDIATIFANGNQIQTADDSLLAQTGKKFKLVRVDVFANQLRSYLKCTSPFLRGTIGMINMAAEVAAKDPRTALRVVYQMTWSAGGDALVTKGQINSPKDLKGKTIALQAYGPHVDYLGKVLSDAGLSFKDVKIKWTKDLTGTDNTPTAALRQDSIDAALVILPDALALTSGGNIGTGAEDSVKSARILVSTKSANRIIADVYAVREDYYKANTEFVAKFVKALIEADESVKKIVQNKAAQQAAYDAMLKASAKILLDSEKAISDTEGMYLDAEFVGWSGNQQFFTQPSHPRRVEKLNEEIQSTLIALGLMSSAAKIEKASWDWNSIKTGGAATEKNAQKFNESQVAKLVNQRTQQGNIEDGNLFSFQVFFQPNQNSFTADAYEKDFNRVIDLASTYGGAVITIEGHSDPLAYLKKKKEGASELVLRQIRQAAKNLSLTRSHAVRDSLLNYSKNKGISLDPSQFAVLGAGIDNPLSGRCGSDPCAPETKQQWLDNMRVVFRIIQVEAEEAVFNPL